MGRQTEVRECLRELRQLGLDVRANGRHHKIFDPKTGAWLFDVSRTPSDANWRYNIERHLRRCGFMESALRLREGKPRKGKRAPAIDLEALAVAQAAAREAGERVPQLADFYDQPQPILRRSGGAYAAEAAEEATMALRADSSRSAVARQRLLRLLEDRRDELEAAARARSPRGIKPGTGAPAEFARVALAEAKRRNLDGWPSLSAATQAVNVFIKGKSVSLRAIEAIEAGIDHLHGLKWDEHITAPTHRPKLSVTPERTTPAPPVGETGTTEEVEMQEPEPVEPEAEFVSLTVEEARPLSDDQLDIRGRYAEVLLELLKSGNGKSGVDMGEVLLRLDKLAGIS